MLIRRFLLFQYFENQIIRKECDANITLFENRMRALSNYFEMACIAGPWSADTVFDYQLSTYSIANICECIKRCILNLYLCICSRLIYNSDLAQHVMHEILHFVECSTNKCHHARNRKSLLLFAESRYRNLCAACEKPASCYNTDKYYGREGALLCLTDGIGDVAWVRLGDARVHFKVTDRSAYSTVYQISQFDCNVASFKQRANDSERIDRREIERFKCTKIRTLTR